MAVTPDYNTVLNNFQTAVKNALNSIEKKISSVGVTHETFDGDTLTLKDNTVHVYSGKTGVRNLHIDYPTGNFISTVLFSTATSGDIKITFKSGTKFVGASSYEFFPAEDWELNICNGRVVGAQIFNN